MKESATTTRPKRSGAWDVERIRSRFPALSEDFGGRPAVFFDNPAGTQVPESVIDAMVDYLRRRNANSDGVFETSRRTNEVIDQAHQAAADLLGCRPQEVAYGANMTTLTFHLSRSLAHEIGPGDEIVLSRLDHDANVAPWMLLARDTGATLRWIDFDPQDCTLDLEQAASLINSKTRLLAVGYASNASGTVHDVRRLADWARQAGALSFVDAVHYAPHGPIDVKEIGCDFLACSPYKFFGPHSGLLYGKRELLERLPAYKVRPASDALPERWETGTLSHEAMAGVTAAIDYLASLSVDFGSAPPEASRRSRLLESWRLIQAWEKGLIRRLMEGLTAIPSLTLYGIFDPQRIQERVCTFILRHPDHDPLQLAKRLARHNIFAWDGDYYALEPARRLGVDDKGGWLRIGLVHYNTPAEIDRFLEVLDSA
ncbi:MAG TPA: cysteine desulfurase-like protein [Acidobacteriota bacterium]|nr:cysteine desulfurase-like protein [Acidobacteriota bacterium]